MDHQNHEKLISEKDGSEIAGVSAETLRQYRSIGILQGVERGGEVFYSRDELAAVFFIRPQHPAREHGFQTHNLTAASPGLTASESTSNAASAETAKFTTSPVTIGGPIQTGTDINRQAADRYMADVDPPYQQAEAQGNSQPLVSSADASSNTEKPQSESVGQVAEEKGKEEFGKTVESDRAPTAAEPATGGNAATLASGNKTDDGGSIYGNERDSGEAQPIDLPYPIQNISASRVPATIDPETSQLTRSLREQIEMLREERDWLRTRLEKLELRYEREQMILLSENDTVRTLISQLGKPKRKWWHALPWLKSEEQKR